MSQVSTAASNFLRQFRSLVAFAEAVEETGDIEARTAELKRQHEQAVEDRAKTIKELSTAQDSLRVKKGELEAKTVEASKIVADAHAKADETLAEAKTKVEDLVEGAKQTVRKMREDASGEVERITLERAALTAEITALTVQRDTIAKELAALRARIGG